MPRKKQNQERIYRFNGMQALFFRILDNLYSAYQSLVAWFSKSMSGTMEATDLSLYTAMQWRYCTEPAFRWMYRDGQSIEITRRDDKLCLDSEAIRGGYEKGYNRPLKPWISSLEQLVPIRYLEVSALLQIDQSELYCCTQTFTDEPFQASVSRRVHYIGIQTSKAVITNAQRDGEEAGDTYERYLQHTTRWRGAWRQMHRI